MKEVVREETCERGGKRGGKRRDERGGETLPCHVLGIDHSDQNHKKW